MTTYRVSDTPIIENAYLAKFDIESAKFKNMS